MYLNYYYKTKILSIVAHKKQLKFFLWKHNVSKKTTLNLNLLVKKSKFNFLNPPFFSIIKMFIFTNFVFSKIGCKFFNLRVNKKFRSFFNKFYKHKVRFAITPKQIFFTEQDNRFEILNIVNFLFNPLKIMQIKKVLKLHSTYLRIPWIFKYNIQNMNLVTKTITKQYMLFLRLFYYNFVRNSILLLIFLNFIQRKKQLKN